MELKRIAVIGGGIIGTAVARELTRKQPQAHITLIEKESLLAQHQSGHNSGVVHAGLDCEPGSTNAKLHRRGVELLTAYTTQSGLPLNECGKLVVAQDMDELERLDTMFERAQAGGVPGVRMLDRTQMREVEPGVRGIAALHSPHTAITDYSKITDAFARDLEAAGGRIMYDSEVKRIDAMGNEVRVRLALPGAQESTMTADGGTYDLVIACAGLQTDRLAEHSGLDPYPKVVPFTRDYFEINGESTKAVRGLITAVPGTPNPVHLTPTTHGALMVGPYASLSLGREGYSRGLSGFKLDDVASTLGFGGFWKYASKNIQSAAREARTAVSPSSYLESARKYVPDLNVSAARPGPRGVLAKAMTADGSLVDELVFSARGRLTQVRSVPAAGATCSMAIAERVVDQALAQVS